MKRLLLLATLAVLLSVPAQAQVRWGARVGFVDGEPMIGGEALVPVGNGFVINPNVELTGELIVVSADAHYDFEINRNASWWLGGGLAIIDPEDADNDFGVNLLGGVGTNWKGHYPYAQVRITSASDVSDFTSVAIGLRF